METEWKADQKGGKESEEGGREGVGVRKKESEMILGVGIGGGREFEERGLEAKGTESAPFASVSMPVCMCFSLPASKIISAYHRAHVFGHCMRVCRGNLSLERPVLAVAVPAVAPVGLPKVHG